MALKASNLSCSVPQWGKLDSGSKRSELSCRRTDTERICKYSLLGGYQAVYPVNDTDQAPLDVSHRRKIDDPGKLQKNLNILPRPLSVNDLSTSPSDSSKVRVAYKGAPGAFSECAARKAYPLCETVPCEQFEAAFKAVELWLVNKAVLPIESSVGGSVHRNYDLLLRHRLHIALAQCKNNLSKLDVVKESVDDTAGAAQFVASNNLRDTGAIASARAAEIYGLDILAERVEVMYSFTFGCLKDLLKWIILLFNFT
ncbi:Arogenate dehydratase/prephenate dehydratase 1 protein [Thalictrum thalictroides]|uniref:Arogenate dehydratase/prephenate dehydratase 1 protein n=1 Tax=Thalictrum thalictroides TaxID=46969 RepID=A0A7J6UST6_THATH|nr:Arogenate dehydratase/prephenate dehydratase 1 protein [Thalictrum thalictroides]